MLCLLFLNMSLCGNQKNVGNYQSGPNLWWFWRFSHQLSKMDHPHIPRPSVCTYQNGYPLPHHLGTFTLNVGGGGWSEHIGTIFGHGTNSNSPPVSSSIFWFSKAFSSANRRPQRALGPHFRPGGTIKIHREFGIDSWCMMGFLVLRPEELLDSMWMYLSIYLSIYIHIYYIYIVVFFYIWVYKPTYHKQRGSTEKQKHRSREGNTKSKQ